MVASKGSLTRFFERYQLVFRVLGLRPSKNLESHFLCFSVVIGNIIDRGICFSQEPNNVGYSN